MAEQQLYPVNAIQTIVLLEERDRYYKAIRDYVMEPASYTLRELQRIVDAKEGTRYAAEEGVLEEDDQLQHQDRDEAR